MNQVNPYLGLRDLLIAMVLADRGINAPGRAGRDARRASKAAHLAVREEIARLQTVGAWNGGCETREVHYRDAMSEVDSVRWGGVRA